MKEYIVETKSLKKYYQMGENTVKALDGVDFRVKVSEYVHGNQSSPEAFKRCSKSTCTGRIRYGAC